MKHATIATGLSLASLALAGKSKGKNCKPMVSSKKLQDLVTIEELMTHAQKFEDVAYASEERNRLAGSKGHNDTVDYIYNTVAAMSDYWDVELQPFNITIQLSGSANLTVDGNPIEVAVMSSSPSGTFVGKEMVAVANVGCEQADYPDLTGKIALISRGECAFSDKSARAGVAGAIGAVIYNNLEGALSGTLGAGSPEIGETIPTAGTSQEIGASLLEILAGSEAVSADLDIFTDIREMYTNNVIATSKRGDANNTLFIGAHSDSVVAGPGINDNGSGSASLLAVAKALYGFHTSSRIRIGWWSAEEHGLLGAEHYVATASPETLQEIRVYLNFDMIASPNYVLGVYDGSGAAFNLTGPPGSGQAQALFEDFFESKDFASIPTEFSGRSDYGPFLDAGVPCGGLFTGAEELKTEEEAALFGGEAGVALDANYHAVGDNMSNLNTEAFEINGKAVAHAVATYGKSFENFPEREPMAGPVKIKKRSYAHTHGPIERAEGTRGIKMSCGSHAGDLM